MSDLPTHATDAAPEGDWQTRLLREAAQSRKYRQRAQRAEADLAELRANALSDQQRREYQQLREQAADIETKTQRIAQLETTLRRVATRSALQAALTACGVRGRRQMDHAAALLEKRIDARLADDGADVRVLDPQGQPLMCADAPERPLAVQEFVAAWLTAEAPHFLPPSGDTGSGAHVGRATPVVSLDALDRDPKRKARFIATHGPQAYVQLARRTGRTPTH